MENSVDQPQHANVAPADNLVRFPPRNAKPKVAFDRRELMQILDLYGRFVAAGEWRDYAMDFGRERAVFSVLRGTAEQPLYRIIKTPEQARRQQQYSVVAQGGFVLKRGNDLAAVLRVLQDKLRA